MAEQTDPRIERAVDVIVRMQRMQDPAAIKGFMPYIRKDAALLLEAIDGPVPDWADLREMARNAGWSGRGGARWVMWGVWSGEDVADEHGWVIYHRFMESTQVTIVGPGTGHMTNRSHAELKDPAPARVLAVARELGLIGGPS